MFSKAKNDFDKIINDLLTAKMRVDILEMEDYFLLNAELPGIKKSEISLEYANDLLTITVNKEENMDENIYLKKERKYSFQERSFAIPAVDFEKSKASLDMGILTVTLPKVKTEGKKIDIE